VVIDYVANSCSYVAFFIFTLIFKEILFAGDWLFWNGAARKKIIATLFRAWKGMG
jgi:hypothetical protein